MLIHCVNIYRVKPGSKRADFTKNILALFTKFGIKSGSGERGGVRMGLVQWDCGLSWGTSMR